MTYNVTLGKSCGKKGIAAPSYGATVTVIRELLGDWWNDADAQKLAVALDHRYTQDGLSVDKLKGIDCARAKVLFKVAEQVDCEAHHALVTLWQSESAEGRRKGRTWVK